jgi:preprotein translocase subunit SecG
VSRAAGAELPNGTQSGSDEVARRGAASRAARVVAALVFVFAALMLLLGNPAPERELGITYKVERTAVGDRAPAKTTTTTEARSEGSDGSLLSRAFDGGSASVLFRLLLAAAIAFLAGAVVQRVWLGEYGVTLGPVSLPALPAVSVATAEEAVDLITESPQISALLGPGPRGPQPHPQFMQVEDDRLAMISIRIEIEERLRELAIAAGLDRDIPLSRLPARLADEGVFDRTAAEGLERYIEVGDRIAAGADITAEAATKLRDRAFGLLYALAELRRRIVSQNEEEKNV